MHSRGKNFTESEKRKLLELVQKYKHIIENKSTNTVTNLKKNQAWESITTEFNNNAEEPRNQKQLNTAYLNLKRVTRQNVVKKDHHIEADAVDGTNLHEGVVMRVTMQVDKCLQQKRDIIKIESDNEEGPSQITTLTEKYNKTPGGNKESVLSDIGLQSVTGDQVEPHSNSCDSASSYYRNDAVEIICDVPQQDPLHPPNLSYKDPPPVTKPTQYKKVRNLNTQLKKNNINIRNDFLKQQYYITKLASARIEKKTKLIEYRMALKKQKLLDLETQIKDFFSN